MALIDNRIRLVKEKFFSACQKAGFSQQQTEELEKKVVENALKFAVARMYEELSKRMKKEEIESLKTDFEKSLNTRASAFSTEQTLEFIRRIFMAYLNETEIEEISDDCFCNEYTLTTDKILQQLNQGD